MKCANKKCTKNPDYSTSKIVVNEKGDMVCNEKCKKEWEKDERDKV